MKATGTRKAIVVAVLGLLLAPTLFASGESEQASQTGTQTLSMWTLFGGGEGYIMEELIAEFNATHEEIQIDEQVVDWDQYYNRLLTSLVGGTAPDIAVMHLAVLPDYASRNVLSPLDEALPESFQDLFLENIIARARYDGELYAIPIDTHPLVLYYNKAVLREAGLVDDAGDVLVPQTWDELYAYAAQVKESTGKAGITLETGSMYGERWFTAVYAQLGGRVLNEQTGTLDVDVDLAQRAYQKMVEPFRSGIAVGPATSEESEALFQDSQSAFHINGVWAMSMYPNIEGFEFGVTEIPTVGEAPHYTWGDSHSLVFPRTGDPARLEAALTFGRWFSNKTMEWATAGHVPVNAAVLESEEFLSLPMRRDYMAAADNAVLAPSVKGWSRVRSEMAEIGELLILGDLGPQEAAERLAAVVAEEE